MKFDDVVIRVSICVVVLIAYFPACESNRRAWAVLGFSMTLVIITLRGKSWTGACGKGPVQNFSPGLVPKAFCNTEPPVFKSNL